MINCLCNNRLYQKNKIVKFPTFLHDEYKTFKKKFKLIYCKKCGLITNPNAKKYQNYFHGPRLSKNSQTQHLVFPNHLNKSLNRQETQLSILKKYVKNKKPSVLDIGCNDFYFLKKFDKIYPSGNFTGFDIVKKFKKFVPNKKNCNFIYGNIKKVKGKFDIITILQCMYWIDINKTIDFLKTRLNKNGAIFISVDNYVKTPVSFLQPDRKFHFTEKFLENFSRVKGFSYQKIKSRHLFQELMIILKPSKKKNIKFVKNEELNYIISSIKKIKTKLLEQKKVDYILGITSKAAFCDEIIKKNIKGFLNEANMPGVRNFRGRKIYHPRVLSKEDNILVLTNTEASKSINRLKKKYKGNFIAIK